VAVTAVHGNSPIDQVVSNIGTILKHMDRQEVPYYKGCTRGFIAPGIELGCGWPGHGADGLGDSKLLNRDDLPAVGEGHASQKMIDIAKKYPNEVEFLCVGPLTNIAMAIRLEPELPSLIKSLNIMGGTEQTKGGASPTSEFNFLTDPEAAYIVFDSFNK
jgi:purine nucleosidase